MVIKSLFVTVFYLIASMTCSLNMLVECCTTEAHAHHPQESGLSNKHHEEHDHDHSGESSENRSSKEAKTCCDNLTAPLISSFKLLQKGLWTNLQLFVMIFSLDSIVRPQKFWIHETDPPLYIRGRPLYKTLYSINAPPTHPY